MHLQWTTKAENDLVRLHDFLAEVNPPVAVRVVQQLVAAAGTLLEHPRLGRPLSEFSPHEVRRLIVGDYELRYALVETTIVILRLWHTREDR